MMTSVDWGKVEAAAKECILRITAAHLYNKTRYLARSCKISGLVGLALMAKLR